MGGSFQGVIRGIRYRISAHRLDHRPRASTCGGCKRGSDAQEIGRSRGGLSTKIHTVVDALGNPLRFILTGGHVHDSKQGEALIEGFDFDHLLADKGYDSDSFRAVIETAGGKAVIPSSRARSQAIAYDKDLYKERNLVERFFCKIKQFRRIATRYEKTALSFSSMLFLAGALIWLK
jgi:transposase